MPLTPAPTVTILTGRSVPMGVSLMVYGVASPMAMPLDGISIGLLLLQVEIDFIMKGSVE